MQTEKTTTNKQANKQTNKQTNRKERKGPIYRLTAIILLTFLDTMAFPTLID